MIRAETSRARIVDFDDTLFVRGTPTRLIGLVGGKLHGAKSLLPTRDDISLLTLQHDATDEDVRTITELFSLYAHSERPLFPGVKKALTILASEGVDVYGNTGRSNRIAWVNMTEEALKKGDVLNLFRGVFYTPEGIKTAVSKAHAIHLLRERYDHLVFDEDDPRTALYVARLFPDVQVNLIHHGSTGLLVDRRELVGIPNLRRVVAFEAHPTPIT